MTALRTNYVTICLSSKKGEAVFMNCVTALLIGCKMLKPNGEGEIDAKRYSSAQFGFNIKITRR